MIKKVDEMNDLIIEIKILQRLLNRLLENNKNDELASDEILNISKKLDRLILEYYEAERHKHSFHKKKTAY
ncbi:aspartyl-phosphate phosphatase Spo0E family protein [Mahella australiensis]|uniref:Diguanylate cyclase n=1 Tax=Mahella australiensis (strain DSM 15567 / CIP 107919 / 50-1 BON) TaxID=697281 RepID=F4A2I3_MAHA5|nr:aspartyl-phosphate phosphatase Spo0E family protein [Mahella australiensis]AEE97249.1 diguanylate cyclase [Mahella australiensis 50-1 BON]